MRRRWLFGLVVFLALVVFAVYPSVHSSRTANPAPESVTLTAGSTKRVAGGRAQLWLSEVTSEVGPGDTAIDAVSVELSCAGETYPTSAVVSSYSEPLCGCVVRLVEVLDTRPPSARLEVIWTADRPLPRQIQAASQGPTTSARAGAAAKTTSRRQTRR